MKAGIVSRVVSRLVVVTIIDQCEDTVSDDAGVRLEHLERRNEYRFDGDPVALVDCDARGQLVSLTVHQRKKRGGQRKRMGSKSA